MFLRPCFAILVREGIFEQIWVLVPVLTVGTAWEVTVSSCSVQGDWIPGGDHGAAGPCV